MGGVPHNRACRSQSLGVLHRTECMGTSFGCRAVRDGLWEIAGQGDPGTGSRVRSGASSPEPRPQPSSRPSGVPYGPLPVLGDWVWFVLGRAKGSMTGARVGRGDF